MPALFYSHLLRNDGRDGVADFYSQGGGWRVRPPGDVDTPMRLVERGRDRRIRMVFDDYMAAKFGDVYYNRTLRITLVKQTYTCIMQNGLKPVITGLWRYV